MSISLDKNAGKHQANCECSGQPMHGAEDETRSKMCTGQRNFMGVLPMLGIYVFNMACSATCSVNNQILSAGHWGCMGPF